MQENELHKLGKTDLLSIIYNQQKEINGLKNQIDDLNKKLEDRTISINEAGSIAEASLKLNDIFAKAQAAADEYLESVKRANGEISQVGENTTKENVEEDTTKADETLEILEEVQVNNEDIDNENSVEAVEIIEEIMQEEQVAEDVVGTEIEATENANEIAENLVEDENATEEHIEDNNVAECHSETLFSVLKNRWKALIDRKNAVKEKLAEQREENITEAVEEQENVKEISEENALELIEEQEEDEEISEANSTELIEEQEEIEETSEEIILEDVENADASENENNDETERIEEQSEETIEEVTESIENEPEKIEISEKKHKSKKDRKNAKKKKLEEKKKSKEEKNQNEVITEVEKTILEEAPVAIEVETENTQVEEKIEEIDNHVEVSKIALIEKIKSNLTLFKTKRLENKKNKEQLKKKQEKLKSKQDEEKKAKQEKEKNNKKLLKEQLALEKRILKEKKIEERKFQKENKLKEKTVKLENIQKDKLEKQEIAKQNKAEKEKKKAEEKFLVEQKKLEKSLQKEQNKIEKNSRKENKIQQKREKEAERLRKKVENSVAKSEKRDKIVPINLIERWNLSRENISKKFGKKESTIDASKIEINLDDLEKEISKRKTTVKKLKFARTLAYSAVVVVAFSIIAATRIFNVLQVSGNSMEPNLYSGELLIVSKFFKYSKGDMIAFYYNDSVLIKRIVATEGDIVYIDDQGVLYVNSEKIEEDYVANLAYGNCNITFPYRVPDKEVFVLGDNRETSVDSRNKAIGSVSEDKILGKIEVKLKPFVIY